MSQENVLKLGSIQPIGANNVVVEAKYVKGGYVAVNTIAERDALKGNNGENIVEGSLCYVAGTTNNSEQGFYQYKNGSWVEANLGGGGGANITIDQTYDSTSANAISGKGVAAALTEFKEKQKLDLIKELVVDNSVSIFTFNITEPNTTIDFYCTGVESDQHLFVSWDGISELETLPASSIHTTHTYEKEGIYTCHVFNLKAVSSLFLYGENTRQALTKVSLGFFCNALHSECFGECINLQEITILNTSPSFGDGTFRNCISLQEFVLPKKVTVFPWAAFGGCSGLEKIYLHKNFENWMATIDPIVLTTLTNLRYIDIDKDNPNYLSEDGEVYDKSKSTLYLYPPAKKPNDEGSLKLSNLSVYNICGNPYIRILELENVRFPSLGIPFYSLSNLEQIYISGGTFVPPSNASIFFSCASNLTKLEINLEQPTSFSTTSPWFDFLPINGIQVKFGKNLLNLPDLCSGTLYLNEIIFEDGDQPLTLPTNCLSNLQGIQFLEFPFRLTKIENMAIMGDYSSSLSLQKIKFQNSCEIGYSNFSFINIKQVSVPNLSTWFNMSFSDSYSNPLIRGTPQLFIEEKNIPMTVLDETNWPEDALEVKPYLFYGYKHLTSIQIPSGVESIGQYAFYSCTNVTTIDIPSSVSTIQTQAFYGHSNLTVTCHFEEQPTGWVQNWIYPTNQATIEWVGSEIEATEPVMMSTWSMSRNEPETEVFYGNIQVNNDIILTHNDQQYSLIKILELLGGYFDDAKI